MKIEWSRILGLILEGPGGEMSDSQPWSGMQNHPQMHEGLTAWLRCSMEEVTLQLLPGFGFRHLRP